MQTADDNRKVISQAFKLTLVLYVFKLVLYFNSIIISNQTRYYLPINRENFLQVQLQAWFAGSLSAMIACY